jgi:hypothetical protein
LGFDQRDNCRGRLQEIGDCGQHQLQRNERLPRCRRIDRRFARRDAKKGIVRSESARASACQEIAAWLRRQGWLVEDPIPPPILGGDGNVECLIEAARG